MLKLLSDFGMKYGEMVVKRAIDFIGISFEQMNLN